MSGAEQQQLEIQLQHALESRAGVEGRGGIPAGQVGCVAPDHCQGLHGVGRAPRSGQLAHVLARMRPCPAEAVVCGSYGSPRAKAKLKVGYCQGAVAGIVGVRPLRSIRAPRRGREIHAPRRPQAGPGTGRRNGPAAHRQAGCPPPSRAATTCSWVTWRILAAVTCP